MKKLSLQWRLTLLTAALVAATCLLLNLFISYSAIMQMDEIENYIIEISPSEEDTLKIDMDGFTFSTDFTLQLQQAKDTFRLQSIVATFVVILISSGLTYILTGRALSPLRQLSSHMEQIQAKNLSEPLEIPDTEDEITRLTRSFNEMLMRLNQAFMTQRQFSANAAHELRTPLAVMQTNLDVLKKREKPTSIEYEETFQRISEQTDRLSHLVNVLLEMTELQTIERTDKISLSALIEEVICDLTQVAENKEVTLIQEDGEVIVVGNDTLLYRAVYNLVENAIKYNRKGGSVTVKAHEENHMAVLSVSDTGIGISEENWKKIFEPFIRVDKSRSRAMGGAGLGLALVQDIANQHGGNVRIIKSSEHGTEFLLTLPLHTYNGKS